MIKDMDRSKYFGASDGKYIFSDNQQTATWLNWWETKKGGVNNFHGNRYTNAGTRYEHSILRAYDEGINFDRQIIIKGLRLRVNLDGNTADEIIECKTHKYEKGFSLSEAYMQQAQLQMYAWNNEEMSPEIVNCDGRPKWAKKNKPVDHVTFVSYGLMPDEYNENYSDERVEEGTIPIDPTRIKSQMVRISRGYQRKIPKVLRKLAKKLAKEEYRRLEGEPFG